MLKKQSLYVGVFYTWRKYITPTKKGTETLLNLDYYTKLAPATSSDIAHILMEQQVIDMKNGTQESGMKYYDNTLKFINDMEPFLDEMDKGSRRRWIDSGEHVRDWYLSEINSKEP